MAVEYFNAYHSYLKSIEPLNDAERGRLFTSLLIYSSTGAVPDLHGNERFIFPTMKEQIDRDRQRYDDYCEKQRENVQKRWKNHIPTQCQTYGGISGNTNDTNDKAKEKEKAKDKAKDNTGETRASARFTPPTLEEVVEYVRSRNSPVDPQEFLDFYAAKGWLVGKTPMKDWRAACRNAEHWDRWQTAKPPAAIQDARPYRNRPPCQTHDAELSEFEQDAIDKMMKRGKYADV